MANQKAIQKIIKSVLTELETGKRDVVMNAPIGIGRSAAIAVIAAAYKGSVAIVGGEELESQILKELAKAGAPEGKVKFIPYSQSRSERNYGDSDLVIFDGRVVNPKHGKRLALHVLL